MIQLVVKICTCCDRPADVCHFQRTLRDLKADRFADIFVEERVVPEWTSSTSSQIP